MKLKTVEECLAWFAEHLKDKKPPVFDFCAPLPKPCPECNYPFDADRPGRIRSVDCLEHMPAHWKHHEKEALEVAKAVDRAETEIKEAL